MFRTDSIYTEPIVPSDTNDTIEHKPAKPQTPYQVLRLLPKDATPAQQDSAIQAWFQPGEIHYSTRPDTLHLPGHGIGKSLKDVNLPQYYREHFFSDNTYLHPELDGGRYGVAGDPIPYTTKNDNIITSMLLVCFVLTLVAAGVSCYVRPRTYSIFPKQNTPSQKHLRRSRRSSSSSCRPVCCWLCSISSTHAPILPARLSYLMNTCS